MASPGVSVLEESSSDIQYTFDSLAIGFKLVEDWDRDENRAEALNRLAEATLVHARTLIGFFVPTKAARDDVQALFAEHYCPQWRSSHPRQAFDRVSGLDLHEVRHSLNVKVMHLSSERAGLPRIDLGDVCRGVITVQHVFVQRLNLNQPWNGTFRQV
jgi:hypothetical protein